MAIIKRIKELARESLLSLEHFIMIDSVDYTEDEMMKTVQIKDIVDLIQFNHLEDVNLIETTFLALMDLQKRRMLAPGRFYTYLINSDTENVVVLALSINILSTIVSIVERPGIIFEADFDNNVYKNYKRIISFICSADDNHIPDIGNGYMNNGMQVDYVGGELYYNLMDNNLYTCDFINKTWINPMLPQDNVLYISLDTYVLYYNLWLFGLFPINPLNPQVQTNWDDERGLGAILNKPTIPAAQVQSDWIAVAGLGVILNKPSIPAAQVQSDWNSASGVSHIANKPTIPAAQVQSDWNATTGLGVILNKPSIPSLSGVAILAGVTGGQTLIGGTAVTDTLTMQGTSGNGTLTAAAIILKVGNNGSYTAMTVLNNGNIGMNITPVVRFHIAGMTATLPENNGTVPCLGTGIRFSSNSGAVVDFGTAGSTGGWIQSFSGANMATNYPFLVNPNGGNVGINMRTAPTAKMHIAAGGTGAGTSCMKFTAGAVLDTAELGAWGYVDAGVNGHLYFTMNVGSVITRREFSFL